MDSSSDARPLNERLHDELIDAVDEELEIEIDDDRLNSLLDQTYRELHADSLDRHTYFRELLRLHCRTGWLTRSLSS